QFCSFFAGGHSLTPQKICRSPIGDPATGVDMVRHSTRSSSQRRASPRCEGPSDETKPPRRYLPWGRGSANRATATDAKNTLPENFIGKKNVKITRLVGGVPQIAHPDNPTSV